MCQAWKKHLKRVFKKFYKSVQKQLLKKVELEGHSLYFLLVELLMHFAEDLCRNYLKLLKVNKLNAYFIN